MFSPLVLAVLVFITLYGGFILLTITNIPVPGLAWYLGFPILGVGIVLQLFSRQLLWIRIYQSTLFSICALTYLFLLWVINSSNNSQIATMGVLIVALSVGTASALIAKNTRKKWQTSGIETPHGIVGVLHERTGMVDPYQSQHPIQNEIDTSAEKYASLGRFSLLIPGITMFLVQVLPQSLLMIGIAITAFVIFSFTLAGAIGAIIDIMSIIDWQRRKGRDIWVKL